ncbi:MAG: branched-chain amino acid ABC transporter permease, partial [Alicyclobacillus sp.]|nr:branched-chain amino acid ABC transporter permease [Alicyclobacillus sp.]
MRRLLAWLVAVAVLVAAPLAMPNDYYVQVLVTAVLYTIAAMGVNFIYGFTGYISFAQAAFFGIGSYTAALLSVDHHWPALLTWIPVVLVSALFGVLLGIPSLRLKGHYLALATIGFTFVLQMLLLNWTAFTHGAQGINNIPPVQLAGWRADGPRSAYTVCTVVGVLLFCLQRNLVRSKVGRSFLAIREDEIAAGCAGIDLTRTKVWAFVWSAIYGGMAGALYAQTSTYISPDTYSFDQSIVFFMMTLIGGA